MKKRKISAFWICNTLVTKLSEDFVSALAYSDVLMLSSQLIFLLHAHFHVTFQPIFEIVEILAENILLLFAISFLKLSNSRSLIWKCWNKEKCFSWQGSISKFLKQSLRIILSLKRLIMWLLVLFKDWKRDQTGAAGGCPCTGGLLSWCSQAHVAQDGSGVTNLLPSAECLIFLCFVSGCHLLWMWLLSWQILDNKLLAYYLHFITFRDSLIHIFVEC